MKKVILKNPLNRGGEIIQKDSLLCVSDEEAEKLIAAGNAKAVKAESKAVKEEPKAEAEKEEKETIPEDQKEDAEVKPEGSETVPPQEEKPAETGKKKK